MTTKQEEAKHGFWTLGEPFVWATGAALTATLMITIVLLVVVLYNGLGVFWPHAVMEITMADGSKMIGEFQKRVKSPTTGGVEIQLKTGNRDFDPHQSDFHWFKEDEITATTYPEDIVVLERLESGNFYGTLKEVQVQTLQVETVGNLDQLMQAALAEAHRVHHEKVGQLARMLRALSDDLRLLKDEIMSVEYQLKMITWGRVEAPQAHVQMLESKLAELEVQEKDIKDRSDQKVKEQEQALHELHKNVVVLTTAKGETATIPLNEIVRYYRPNAMGFGAKIVHYVGKVGEFLTTEPRESNTEGGLFPAIFGTIMLIFLMALTSFPLGVMAGVYLREYAKDGILVRLVRIAVNNLAGIPSIVYGIFGLGFFIYIVGDGLDAILYPHRVHAGEPTFGTGGILWAAMTLGILTVPVVIVSVEEALGAIPMGVREGSLALGATKLQTLCRVLLPMASPGILTGFILAMARAAGEVAPLMITGVVKLAPTLPIDSSFPFGFDRKFMHLGFHIYDIGFQSPNVEAAMPMVYTTTLLLLVIVLVMTSLAIVLRNRMRKAYEIRSI